MVILVKGHVTIDVDIISDREIKEKLEANGFGYEEKPFSTDILFDRELKFNHLDVSQIKRLSKGEILHGRVKKCAIVPKKDSDLFIPILVIHSEPIKEIHKKLIEHGYRNQGADFEPTISLSEPVIREKADEYLKFMNDNLLGYIVRFKQINVYCIEDKHK